MALKKIKIGDTIYDIGNDPNQVVGAPITPVTVLPDATEENLNQYKLYDCNGSLAYITQQATEEPAVTVGPILLKQKVYKACCARVDNYIYRIGGTAQSENFYNTIERLNITTGESEILNITIGGSLGLADATCQAIGTNIYIFGGAYDKSDYASHYKTLPDIYKLDTLSLTLTKLTTASIPDAVSASFTLGRSYMTSAVVGRYVYLFGGYYELHTNRGTTSGPSNTIYKFDTETETLAAAGTVLPQKIQNASAVTVGTDIYIIGGSRSGTAVNEIVKFDTVAGTIEMLDVQLPVAAAALNAVNIQDTIFIYGYSDIIYKFNPTSQEITTLDAHLPVARTNTCSAVNGTDVYIIGGYSNSVSVSDYFKIQFGAVVTRYSLATQEALDITQVRLNNKVDVFQNEVSTALNATTNQLKTDVAGLRSELQDKASRSIVDTKLSFEGATPSTYEIINLGTTYGFSLNSDGYYQSENKSVHSSYAICKVNFKLNIAQDIKIDCINYAESSYDYGLLSNIDTTLTSSSTADTSNVFKSFKSAQSSSVVTVTYPNVSAGSHFIYIKFIKDSSGNSNNDTLQFKIQDLENIPLNLNVITDGTNSVELGSGNGNGTTIIHLVEDEPIASEYLDKLENCVLEYEGCYYYYSINEHPDYSYVNISGGEISYIAIEVTDGSWRSYSSTYINLMINLDNYTTVPEQFQDLDILKGASLVKDGIVYKLSSHNNNKLIYSSLNSQYYRTITIGESDYAVSTRSYGYLATTSQVDTLSRNITELGDDMVRFEDNIDIKLRIKQDQLIAGPHIEIIGNRIESLLPTVDVVDTLPEANADSYNANKFYSYDGNLYCIDCNVSYDGEQREPTFLDNDRYRLPYKNNGMGTAVIGKTIYLVGGYPAAYQTDNKFIALDTETNMWTSLPSPGILEDCPMVAVGNKLYVADTSWHIFNLETGSWSTTASGVGGENGVNTAAVIGRFIYTVSPNGNIYKFDTTSHTTTSKYIAAWEDCSDVDVAGCSVEAIGDKLYIFGGYTTPQLVVYDTVAETYEIKPLWSDFIGDGLCDAASVVVGDKIYIFGGKEFEGDYEECAIHVYDTVLNTWSTLDLEQHDGNKDAMAVLIDGICYLIGGSMVGYDDSTARITRYDLNTATATYTYSCTQLTSGSSASANVEPNPTEEATEVLSKIKVDDVIYSIAGGTGGNNSSYVEDTTLFIKTVEGATEDRVQEMIDNAITQALLGDF